MFVYQRVLHRSNHCSIEFFMTKWMEQGIIFQANPCELAKIDKWHAQLQRCLWTILFPVDNICFWDPCWLYKSPLNPSWISFKSHCINVGGCTCSTHDHHSNCLQLDSKPQHFQMWDLCKSQWTVVDVPCHGWTWEVMSCWPEVVGFQWSNQVSWRLRNWDGPFF